MIKKDIIICGGGASGFFTAINIAAKNPTYNITILEKSNKLLSKVRISGGGRCNVTNAREKPSELVKFYPRGEKKLYKSFQVFSTDDMINWLSKRGVKTKTEPDQRVFPTTDSSETIINCFLDEAHKYNIKVITNEGLKSIHPEDGGFEIMTTSQEKLRCDILIVATGSSPAIWKQLEQLNFDISPPVPSLFTFNIKDKRIESLQGISFNHVEIKVATTKLKETGPLLITHWGLSGPAVLKLSAWGARELATLNYKFNVLINFIPDLNFESCKDHLKKYAIDNPKKNVLKNALFDVPKRYWENICKASGIGGTLIYNDIGNKSINKLADQLTQASFQVTGKSTFKEEFVTCGGIKLSEIDLNNFESRKYPGMFFTGEVLDIDAITGGFNFQACWSSAWIISEHLKNYKALDMSV